MEDKIFIFIISIVLVIGFGIRDVNAHKFSNRKMVKENSNYHGHHSHVRGHAHHSKGLDGKDNDNDQVIIKPSVNGVDSIKIVNQLCASTTYKESCIKSLNSLASKSGSNPQVLFKNGVKLALDETSKVSNIPTTLLLKATSKRANSAIESCKDLLEQSTDRLKMASDQVTGNLDMTLKDPSAILNLRLELGDVNTFSTNCLDEVDEAEAPQLKQIMQERINNAKELSVNLLDIVSTYNF